MPSLTRLKNGPLSCFHMDWDALEPFIVECAMTWHRMDLWSPPSSTGEYTNLPGDVSHVNMDSIIVLT